MVGNSERAPLLVCTRASAVERVARQQQRRAASRRSTKRVGKVLAFIYQCLVLTAQHADAAPGEPGARRCEHTKVGDAVCRETRITVSGSERKVRDCASRHPAALSTASRDSTYLLQQRCSVTRHYQLQSPVPASDTPPHGDSACQLPSCLFLRGQPARQQRRCKGDAVAHLCDGRGGCRGVRAQSLLFPFPRSRPAGSGLLVCS